MPMERGSAFLLKVGDGASPPVYATVAGLRTTQLSVNGEAVVVTHKGSGGWRELLSGAGVRSVFVWALPQVIRDGLIWFDEESDMDAFADVSFPLAIGREASVAAITSTAIAAGAGGHEQRNAEWAEARLDVSRATFLTGEAMSVKLIEVREG